MAFIVAATANILFEPSIFNSKLFYSKFLVKNLPLYDSLMTSRTVLHGKPINGQFFLLLVAATAGVQYGIMLLQSHFC